MPPIKIHGMIDPHTHLRDLDWSHKGSFASETKAAIAGGYWAVFDMPNTAPSTIDDALLSDKLARIDKSAHCDWGLYFGASQADNSAEYESIASRVCGLKMYNNSTTGDLLIESSAMRERHYRAWTPIRPSPCMPKRRRSPTYLDLVRKYRQPTHFLHISSEYEIKLLTQAKQDGLPITVGVCPHHLFLSEDDLPTLGAFGMMKPELKRKSDVARALACHSLGVVDIIESDHAPHTIAEKEADEPAYGVPGLETTLPLMMQAVKDGRLGLQQACDMVSLNVQRIWRITPLPKTYTLVDADHHYLVERARSAADKMRLVAF